MGPLRFCASEVLLLADSFLFAQGCPTWGDKQGALQFLLANRPRSTAADSTCVNTAFATLSHDIASAEALVGLLDFERSTEHDDFKTEGRRFPAINALMHIGKPAVPYLIKAIKESDSELVRTNAATTLGGVNGPCPRRAMAILDAEANKPGTTAEQVQRLMAARGYIGNLYHPCEAERTHY